MAVSKREEALAGVAGRLGTITNVTVLRTPNFDLGLSDLPAVVLFDGEEQVDDLQSGILNIRTACTVVVVVRAEQDKLGPALNALHARVRQTIGADPTLSGKVSFVAYRGAEEPVFVTDEVPHAMMPTNYEILRQEAEFDPFAYV